MSDDAQWTKVLHARGRRAGQLGILLRRINDAIGLRPNSGRRHELLKRVGVHGSIVSAASRLLPDSRLAQIADAKVVQVAAEELDAGEVGGQGDEGCGDGAGAGPEAQGPLHVGPALGVRDYGC